MAETFPWLGPLVVAACAIGLVLVPRPLFAEVAEASPRRRLEIAQGIVLFVAGAAVVASGLGGEPWNRVFLALALMVLAAVVYADLRFLIIPDAYSIMLALLAVIGPIAQGLSVSIPGAILCGGLLYGVAYLFKRSTEVEGMGFGDVKLAAAIGALLGMELGVWAIAISAIGAGAVGLTMRTLAHKERSTEPLMLPYGAALALVGAAFLIWSRR
jgi:leader peptidase (prepilin peptidase)/N-methyltransferase